MKKISLLLFFALIFIFTGCSNSTVPLTNFSCDFTIAYNGEQIQGTLINNSNKLTKIKVKSPNVYHNVTFTYKGSALKISHKGYNVKGKSSYLPSGAFSSVIHNVLFSIANTKYKLDHSEKGYNYIKGNTESGSYIVKVEKNSGAIRAISLDSINFKCRFSNIIEN